MTPTAIQKVDMLLIHFNRLLLSASPELVPGILREPAFAALLGCTVWGRVVMGGTHS